jgi:hypothetical protein
MIEALSPGLRRILAVGLFALAALLLIVLTVGPCLSPIASERERRVLLLKERNKLQKLVDSEAELTALLAKIDAHPLWQRTYRGAATHQVESEMQKDIRTLADAQGISIETVQPLDPVDETVLKRLSLRVGFTTTIDHLSQLLLGMAAAPHYLQFQNLYVTSPMSQNAGANPVLVVRGDVSAYQLADPSP